MVCLNLVEAISMKRQYPGSDRVSRDLVDEGIPFAEITARRDLEMNPEAAASTEVIQPEAPGGVIASGEVRLPNVVSYDFFAEQIYDDFSGGMLVWNLALTRWKAVSFPFRLKAVFWETLRGILPILAKLNQISCPMAVCLYR